MCCLLCTYLIIGSFAAVTSPSSFTGTGGSHIVDFEPSGVEVNRKVHDDSATKVDCPDSYPMACPRKFYVLSFLIVQERTFGGGARSSPALHANRRMWLQLWSAVGTLLTVLRVGPKAVGAMYRETCVKSARWKRATRSQHTNVARARLRSDRMVDVVCPPHYSVCNF